MCSGRKLDLGRYVDYIREKKKIKATRASLRAWHPRSSRCSLAAV
jgi:hypothetical protein